MDVLEVSKKEHKKEFRVLPVIIGIKWADPYDLADAIDQAIEDGVPYDERKLLSKEQLKAYNDGTLLF